MNIYSPAIEKKKTMQSTILVPSSIIGKVFITGMFAISQADVKMQVALGKIEQTKDRRYWECRVLSYRPETGELLLRLDSTHNNDKLFNIWLDANQDWVSVLSVRYIFIQ